MKLHALLIGLLVGVTYCLPVEDGVNEETKQILAIEELRQNLSTLWSEIYDIKVNLETHIKESDPQYFYDPHHEHHEGEYHGDHHNDSHHHEHDHHHDGDHHHHADENAEGRSLESGQDHAYDDHHHHHEEYDHHHHHHEDSDHHLQHEGSGNDHDHLYDDHHHHGYDDHHHHDHHEGEHDHSHQEGKSGDQQEDKDDQSNEDNSEENEDDKPSGSIRSPRNDSPQSGSEDSHDHGHHEHHHHRRYHQEFLKAKCHLLPNSEVPESSVSGHITITQNKDGTGPLYFKIDMKGFEVSGEEGYVHGFHIHENDIQEQKCSSAGPHFNPEGITHGAPYAVTRHVGDLGNIRVDNQGRYESRVITDDHVAFFGKNSIIGRSIVVHQKADDLGLGGDEESLKTGNAGARLACCTIESINIPKPFKSVIRFNG